MSLDADRENKRLMALIEEMTGESDRSVAIVGAAWVEESLAAAIEAFLEPHAKSVERLLQRTGPLAAFSAKIDLARLLGMTSNEIWSDLHAIRKIRNEFAHVVAHEADQTRLTFASGQINLMCMGLNCVSIEKPTDARAAFTRACAILNADFETVRFFGVRIENGGRVIARGMTKAL